VYRQRYASPNPKVQDPCPAVALPPVVLSSNVQLKSAHHLRCWSARPNRRIGASARGSETYHPPLNATSPTRLSLAAPDALEESVTLCQPVEGIVALAHSADEAGEGVDDVLALDGAAVLVNLGDRNLARAVVFGLDDAARRRALAGDVAGKIAMSEGCPAPRVP
jgi:hypothetical protein